MTEWVKVGMDVATGGVLGVADQLVANEDAKRWTAAGARLSLMKQYGTYYNYGVPVLAVVATAMGWLKGDWATRILTAGSVLAGRKVTWQITNKDSIVPSGSWSREYSGAAQLAAQRAAAQLAAARGAQPSHFEVINERIMA